MPKKHKTYSLLGLVVLIAGTQVFTQACTNDFSNRKSSKKSESSSIERDMEAISKDLNAAEEELSKLGYQMDYTDEPTDDPILKALGDINHISLRDDLKLGDDLTLDQERARALQKYISLLEQEIIKDEAHRSVHPVAEDLWTIADLCAWRLDKARARLAEIEQLKPEVESTPDTTVAKAPTKKASNQSPKLCRNSGATVLTGKSIKLFSKSKIKIARGDEDAIWYFDPLTRKSRTTYMTGENGHYTLQVKIKSEKISHDGDVNLVPRNMTVNSVDASTAHRSTLEVKDERGMISKIIIEDSVHGHSDELSVQQLKDLLAPMFDLKVDFKHKQECQAKDV